MNRRLQRIPTIEQLEVKRLLAEVSIAAASAGEDQSAITFTLTLDEAAAEPLKFLFDTIDGSAVAGQHYIPVVDRLIDFQPGENSKVVQVELIDDAMRNLDREFTARVNQIDDAGRIVPIDQQLVLPPGTNSPSSFELDPTASSIVYRSFSNKQEILSIPLDGSAAPTLLAEFIIYGQQTGTGYAVNPNNGEVIFRANIEDSDSIHFYRIQLNGSASPSRLSGPLDDGSISPTSNWKLTPDGKTLIYIIEPTDSNELAIFSVSTDGSSAPMELARGPINYYTELTLSPDGESLIFEWDQPGNETFIVPVDGSAPARKLAENLSNESTIPTSQFSSDSEYVFFRARTTAGQYGTSLYRVATDGSSPPISLADNVGSASIKISPNGSRIVYRVDRGLSAPHELFSVPTDGSQSPARLHPELDRESEAWREFQFSDDSERVYFSVNFEDTSIFSLYSTPVDGGGALTKLAEANKPNLINRILNTGDPNRIVYQVVDRLGSWDSGDVYSVAIDGTTEPILLSPAAESNSRIDELHDLRLNADGRTVTFISTENSPTGAAELVLVPVDGSRPPSTINVPLLENQIVPTHSTVQETSDGFVYRLNRTLSTSTPNLANIAVTRVYETQVGRIVDNDLTTTDFGDAPAASDTGFASDYPVTLADDGARHVIGSLFLGLKVDSESDGQPHKLAGTNGTGGDEAGGDEADMGIQFFNDLVVSSSGTVSSVQVSASDLGMLDAWIDFNHDGDWTDAGEQILASVSVSAGNNHLSFPIPPGANHGDTAARFRLSTSGGLSATGNSPDGEVEDYWLNLVDGDLPLGPISIESLSAESGILIAENKFVVRDGSIDRFSAPIDSISNVQFIGNVSNERIDLQFGDWNGKRIQIDGAGGIDTLYFIPSSMPTDSRLGFDLIDSLRISEIERIDLVSDDNIVVALDRASIQAMTSDGAVMIVGNHADQIQLTDPLANWRTTETFVVNDRFIRRISHVDGGSIDVDIPRHWTNVVQHMDVNNDGQVSALDALVVINRLAQVESNDLPDAKTLALWPGLYFDSTSDDKITALDALVVINEIARQQESIESEAELPGSVLKPGQSQNTTAYVSHEETSGDRELFGRRLISLETRRIFGENPSSQLVGHTDNRPRNWDDEETTIDQVTSGQENMDRAFADQDLLDDMITIKSFVEQ